MHLHWTRSELVASALGYAGNWWRNPPGAGRDAPHGRSRINLRKSFIGTGDFLPVSFVGEFLFRVVRPTPMPSLALALEPAIAPPCLVIFKPPVELADACLDIRIDHADLIDHVAPDLELIVGQGGENPVGLPMVTPNKKKLVVEIWMP